MALMTLCYWMCAKDLKRSLAYGLVGQRVDAKDLRRYLA